MSTIFPTSQTGAASRAEGSTSDDTTASGRAVGPPSGFRLEIEGLRAVAVLLVAVYHVWFNRVSGGVDVFLFLTGFFITLSLIRSVERHGGVRPTHFLARLARRLLPTAAVVAAGILAAAYLWLPASRWPAVFRETIASLLYVENWALATKAVDYLSRDEAPSPLQHFWSLSIQGQFYPLWIVLIAVAVLIAHRGRGIGLRKTVFALCAVVFAVSLTYAIVTTETRQAWAYFDTGARLWELALGGMFGLVLPRLRLPVAVRVPLGWIGLAALLSCGALLEVSIMFPGWIALWPLAGAMCVILAGNTGRGYAADRLLTWKPVIRLGAWSYALYLWHWPVLVVYLNHYQRETASLLGGCVVIGVALALAAATTWIVEGRVAAFVKRFPGRRWSLAVAAAFAVPLLVVTLVAQHVHLQRHAGPTAFEKAQADPESYPGAAVLTDPRLAARLEERPFIPSLDNVQDYPLIYEQGCDPGVNGSEAKACYFGDEDAEHTVALVGGSRIAHWFPAFHGAAKDAGLRLVSITKSGCQFSTDIAKTAEGKTNQSCVDWNEGVLEILDELRPDLAVTLATRSFTEGSEGIYEGFADRWRTLEKWNVDVLALRDLPRLEEKLPQCLERESVEQCSTPVSMSRPKQDPTTGYVDLPSNVKFDDLVEYVCPDGSCPAVIGNILTFRDNSHLTATYAASIAPYVEQCLKENTDW